MENPPKVNRAVPCSGKAPGEVSGAKAWVCSHMTEDLQFQSVAGDPSVRWSSTLCLRPTHMRTLHTQTHTHTRTHTHTHTHTYTRTQTRAHTPRTNTRTCAQTHAHAHKHTHARTNTRTHTHTHTHTVFLSYMHMHPAHISATRHYATCSLLYNKLQFNEELNLSGTL